MPPRLPSLFSSPLFPFIPTPPFSVPEEANLRGKRVCFINSASQATVHEAAVVFQVVLEAAAVLHPQQEQRALNQNVLAAFAPFPHPYTIVDPLPTMSSHISECNQDIPQKQRSTLDPGTPSQLPGGVRLTINTSYHT